MLSFVTGLLFVVDITCAFLLIGIILIQQSKSGGGLGAVAGGATESVFGAAAGNIITKTTVILASTFLVSTLLLAILSGHTDEDQSIADRIAAEEAAEAESLSELPVDVGDAEETVETAAQDQPAADAEEPANE
jgi:preprotein translocase subunit SecG